MAPPVPSASSAPASPPSPSPEPLPSPEGAAHSPKTYWSFSPEDGSVTTTPIDSFQNAVPPPQSFYRGQLNLWKSPFELEAEKLQSSSSVNPPSDVSLIRALAVLAGEDYVQSLLKPLPKLIEGLKDKDPTVRWEAAQKLGEIGVHATAALSPLLEALKDPTPRVQEEAAIALMRITRGDLKEVASVIPPLLAALKDQDAGVRLRGIEAIGFLNESWAKMAIPDLRALLQDADPRIRTEAAITLSCLSILGRNFQNQEELIPPLTAALQDGDPFIRKRSALALACLAGGAWKAMPDLQAALKNEADPEARVTYLAAIRAIGPYFSEMIPTLIALLQDPEEDVRVAAVLILGDYGGRAKDAVPDLFKLLAGLQGKSWEKQRDYLRSVSDAIAKIASQDRSVLPQVMAALQSTDWSREGAFLALRKIEPPAKEAVPFLIDLLKKESYLASSIFPILEKMGPEAKAAIPVLESNLQEKSMHVAEAAWALGAIGAEAKSTLLSLVTALERANERSRGSHYFDKDRIAIAKAIGQIAEKDSPELASAVSTLSKILLTDSFKYNRVTAAQALGEIGPKAHSAVPALVGALEDVAEEDPASLFEKKIYTNPVVRWESLLALEKIGPEAREALPALKSILLKADVSSGIKQQAIKVLMEMGEEAQEAFPELVKLLKDPDEHIRNASAGALKTIAYKIKNKSEKVMATLVSALNDSDPWIRKEAVLTLSHLPWAEISALPALRKSLTDEDPVVKLQSLRILKRLGPQAKEAIPDLVERLQDENPIIQLETVRTLGSIGPEAKEAIPALKELLTRSGKDPAWLRSVREALRQIQI